MSDNTIFLFIAFIPFFALVLFIVWAYWRQNQKEKLKTPDQQKQDKAIASIKQTRGYGVTFVLVGFITLFKASLATTVVGILFIAIGIYLAWSVHEKENQFEKETQKEHV